MPKPKTVFICTSCGCESAKWMGRCPNCGEWNTLEERAPQPTAPTRNAPAVRTPVQLTQTLDEIDETAAARVSTGMGEFDRVLGGGVVPGSLVLVGGDPGIGKSTLLLQVSAHLASTGARVLYVSGEESQRQIKMRARRLELSAGGIYVLSETAMDVIEGHREALTPDYMIVDSIQTMYRPDISSAPGSVTQVRECTTMLMRAAKSGGCGIFLVGHVTKEGALAGPRVLEHMVDAVLYFEGDRFHNFRNLRSVKNRFGAAGEIGIFEMRDKGCVEVQNPSAALLAGRELTAAGSAVTCALEGSRPLLVDVQALVSPTVYNIPRRQASGVDGGRLALLLAVLEKRAGLRLYNQDAYVNVVGGLVLSEPAADLPVCMAVASSMKNKPIPYDWAIMGEVGLTGEVRAVGGMERRMQECARQGFTGCVAPLSSVKGVPAPEGMQVMGVRSLKDALALL